MADMKIVKTWNALEVQLNQAFEFLLSPERFQVLEQEFEECERAFQVSLNSLR
jgi:hypothetical protein